MDDYNAYDLAKDLFELQGNVEDAIYLAEDITDEDLMEEVIERIEQLGGDHD